VDGTTDLKEAFDIDEYDWGYFVFWSQGVTGAAGTATTTTFADPMVKGSWYLTERTDDGDVSAPPIVVGARFAHFRTVSPITTNIPALATGATAITAAQSNTDNATLIQIGGTLPIVQSVGTTTLDTKFTASSDLKVVMTHSIVVRNVSGASNTIGFTILPTRWTGLTGSVIDCLLDTATGNDGSRIFGETGTNSEMLGAVASGGRLMFIEFKSGQAIEIVPQNNEFREIYISGAASTAVVAVEHDIIFTELPSDFGLKKKPNLNQKEEEFERRVEQRIRQIEDRMFIKPSLFEPEKRQKRSISETRQKKLADAVAGDISPTPSVVADIKAGHFDVKDQKSKK